MFKDKFYSEEEDKARQLSFYCKSLCSVELDFALYTENQILQERDYGMGFATARQLIYGEEFTEPIPLPPLEQYIWALMSGAYQVMAYIRSVEALNLPLNYPTPEGKFYGYDRPIHVRDGTVRAGTKQVVNNICLAASAIIAHQTQYHVRDKHEAVYLYRAEVGDRWADFIQELYEVGRNQWAQVIPEDEAAQSQFRRLCQQALEFERHFLTIYKIYLLEVVKDGRSGTMQEAAQRKLQKML
jgi:hypothetical protein